MCVYRARFSKIASAFIAILMLLGTRSSHGSDDLWPLVKKAEKATWGILTDVIDGDEDRLLVIEVTWDSEGRNARGTALLRLLERGGRHVCGSTCLHIGDRGLFLYGSAVDGSGEFAAVDGRLLTGGFLPVEADARARASFARLFASRPEHTVSSPPPASGAVDGTALDASTTRKDELLDVLASEDAILRSMALGCLREECNLELDAFDRQRLADHFLDETDSIACRSYLELFLLRGWSLAGERATQIVISGDDSELIETALIYLEHHGTLAGNARLLLEFPDADLDRRLLLLHAYARLGLEEAAPWWQEALLSDEPKEVRAAMQTMAVAAPDGAEDIYIQLTSSENPKVRKMALRGLATLATPRARQALQNIGSEDEDDSVGRLARNILKNPRRYGRTKKVSRHAESALRSR